MKIKKILAVAAVLAMAALGTANAGMTAFAGTEDDTLNYYPLEENDDTLVEDEAEAIYDEPYKGEGYYVCRISFHDGVPEIHDENGDIYAIWDEEGGYMQEGETRKDVENAVAESMREQLVSIGADPDDYGFDVYVYFYDDYDLTSEEFFDFVNEDILRRDSERDKPTANVPNPVTGAGLPCTAAVLAVLSAAGIFAANKKKLS